MQRFECARAYAPMTDTDVPVRCVIFGPDVMAISAGPVTIISYDMITDPHFPPRSLDPHPIFQTVSNAYILIKECQYPNKIQPGR